MKLPKLRVLENSRQIVDAFRGYNHNLRIGENEFYDMKNMTSDHYPVLSTRGKRGLLFDEESNVKASGLISKGELCRVEEGDFFVGASGAATEMGLSDEPKKMVSMGAYVIILPDKKWVSTAPNKNGEYEWGDIEAKFERTGMGRLENCDKDGKDLEGVTKSEEAPEDPENGKLWLDISTDPATLKKYFSGSKSWGEIECYIKISAKGIAEKFDVGDSVYLKGFLYKNINGQRTLYGCDKVGEYIIIKGAFYDFAGDLGSESNMRAFSVERKLPDMDFIIEHNNRLWGCKYGETEDGTFVNEIYASKLGDFKNWYCFDGVSTDSYTASCGSDGPFTGAITYGGHPLFFKENGVHKAYGDYPANFQVQYVPMPGVQEGCENSLAIVGNTLFYKSRNAVCAYDGSMPVEISSAFGEERYSNAEAGAHGNKYYINMADSDGKYHLFVYDNAKGMWHREDNIRVDNFCSHKNYLYAIEKKNRQIVILDGAEWNEVYEDKVDWYVETGTLGMSLADMKYVSRLLIRMSLEESATVEISIQYDSGELWEQVCNLSATSLRSFCIPVRPKRCDHFRLKIKGEGGCKIYSITKTIEQGSEIS